ncbi:hypothetical protein AADG42_00195 [Ammonicoccus fulvus]|uniref:Uncharacterized protein n=1 Tax=Ammonicoccus fulvus TaxID=3138240 RepID=A0ABZ3FIE4_9ACTN
MSFASKFNEKRAAARASRKLQRAIREAGSSTMRDELLIAAQRGGLR